MDVLGSPSTNEMARRIRENRANKAADEANAQKSQEEAERVTYKKRMADIQSKYSAADSHVQNDAYLNEFETAWEKLMVDDRKGKASGAGALERPSSSNAFLIEQSRGMARPDSRAGLVQARTRNLVNRGKITAAAPFQRHPAQVLGTWRSGPTDPAGIMCDISDRPSLCSAANWAREELVIGSSDHALYIIDAKKGTKKRQLYNKTCGHNEWVTTVCCTPDGKVVSGGMDSRLWMWPAASARGIQMEGHAGPISQVEYDGATGLVVSCSYDKTVRMWQCGSRGEEKAMLTGHEAPIMHMGISSTGQIISGDRSGHVILWDTTANAEAWRMKNVHKGQVSALAWCDPDDPNLGSLFISGGQDGYVRVWDHRERKNPARIQLHVNAEGRGAVTSICAGGAASAGMVVTCGADGTMRVLDPRKSFGLMHTCQLTNFPYSMAVAGGLALVGCGDGALQVFDIREGTCLYALGAHKGAVRCIEACEDRLATSGDDGNVVLWNFPALETA